MSTLCVKPARAGDVIRDPLHHRPLAPEGAEVSLDGPAGATWRRRLARGEVVETTPAAIAKGKAEREASVTATDAGAPETAPDTSAEPTASRAGEASADGVRRIDDPPGARRRPQGKE